MMPYSMYPAQQYPQYAFYPAQMPSIPPSQMKSGATKTIALTGWPDNVKERELNNLLLFFTGYQVRVCPNSSPILSASNPNHNNPNFNTHEILPAADVRRLLLNID